MAASTGSDRSILVWDVARGLAIRRLTGHSGTVVDLAFFADGERLLSTADDDSVRVWRLDPGAEALQAWIAANRAIPELTCSQRRLYRISPLCD